MSSFNKNLVLITDKTVLVLGAGASYRFGYPLGSGLKRKILTYCNVDDSVYQEIRKDGPWDSTASFDDTVKSRLRYLWQNRGYDITHIQKFSKDFHESPLYSIDAFLENRPEFLELGKVLIAMSIFSFEDKTLLYNPKSERGGHWYQYLFNEMTASCTFDCFNQNKLSIITYNYDRSFEYYFINSLIHTFGKSADESMDVFNSIPRVHLHGEVEAPPWGAGIKPYNKDTSPGNIDKAVEKLHIISEEAALKDSYEKAHDILSQAKQIFILGFGFDTRNLERLALKRFDVPISATRTGISDLNVSRINQRVGGKIRFSVSKDSDIVEFWDNEIPLQR